MEKTGACIGIDLGTTNSLVAISTGLERESEILSVAQLASPDSVTEKELLPSALYFPLEGEVITDSARLPWENQGSPEKGVVGIWAKERGALVPNRFVHSAKSWLSHAGVDRRSPILPWGAEDSPRISPVEASQRYLEHLGSALRHDLNQRGMPGDLQDCQIVLTVPASFDEVARHLTFEAAEAAGLGRVTLLEEPQAALYAWISAQGENWRKSLQPGDLVLVVDVGGGTTDFSLIAVTEQKGNLHLERISVGEHLLLGGDNMDLTLAYHLSSELEAKGTKVDKWQFQSLLHGARLAKEQLLSDPSLKEIPVAAAGKGASLFGKTIRTVLTAEAVERILLEGFFPSTSLTEMPAVRRSVGLTEYGLPFVSDPAIPKHLARFLVRSLENIRSHEHLAKIVGKDHASAQALLPSAILFNGGVFNARAFCERVLSTVQSWSGEFVRELPGKQVDLAVAKGAAYYARTLVEKKGIRIRAGTSRSYYLGLETSVPAVPGFKPPIKGVCVVPQGLEEGSDLHLPNRSFGLVTGEPVEFRFFCSAVRAGDKPGEIVEDAERELEETSRLQITLPAEADKGHEVVPVELDAVVTEVGTLELWMRNPSTGKRWNLEFSVRPS